MGNLWLTMGETCRAMGRLWLGAKPVSLRGIISLVYSLSAAARLKRKCPRNSATLLHEVMILSKNETNPGVARPKCSMWVESKHVPVYIPRHLRQAQGQRLKFQKFFQDLFKKQSFFAEIFGIYHPSRRPLQGTPPPMRSPMTQ